MSEGKIASWTAKIGDKVTAGEVYCEVETDKATVSYDAQDDGYLAKILIQAGGDEVTVGAKIGIIVDDLEDVAAFENYIVGGAAPPKPAATPAPEPTAAPTPVREPSIKFTHGKQPEVAAPVVPVVPSGGRVIASPFAKSLAAENGVDLRTVVGSGPKGRIVAEDVRKAMTIVVSTPPTPVAVAAPTPVAAAPAPTPTPVSKPPPMSVSVSGVPYVDVFPIPPRPETGLSGAFEDVPLNNMRKIIGQRLTESKMSIPHYYVSVGVELDNLMKMRGGLNKVLADKNEGKLSVNDFIIKASSYALQKVPEANSMWQGNSIRENKFVDISVAVDTGKGLITPIVRNVEAKGLLTISKEVKELVKKSKENKLIPSDYQGGTFTISNMGMMGVKDFTAIINPPQSCILAVSSAEKVVKAADTEKGFRVATVMNVSLSSDHRVVDGAMAARWVNAFKEALENPEILML